MSRLCCFSVKINIDYDLSFDLLKAETFSLILLGLFLMPFSHLSPVINDLFGTFRAIFRDVFSIVTFSLCELWSLANLSLNPMSCYSLAGFT